MSSAYRGQGTVSEINQNLQAARQMLVSDIRMAGFGLAPGTGSVDVAVAVDATLLLDGFSIQNDANGDGNDSFRLVYSRSTENISVTNLDTVSLDYTSPDGTPTIPVGTPIVIATQTAACLVSVTAIDATKIYFGADAPFNPSSATQCAVVDASVSGGQIASVQTVVIHSYRIDPTRPTAGYLQMSPSGEIIADDWVDMGVGFTNLQIASRYFEAGDGVDVDGDGDPLRDWYSTDNQANPDPSFIRPITATLIQVSLSIEGRGAYGTVGASSSQTTPAFVDMGNVDNNPIGDWGQVCAGAATSPCGIHLSVTADASRPARYRGEHVYRYTRSTIDLRNLGIGQ